MCQILAAARSKLIYLLNLNCTLSKFNIQISNKTNKNLNSSNLNFDPYFGASPKTLFAGRQPYPHTQGASKCRFSATPFFSEFKFTHNTNFEFCYTL